MTEIKFNGLANKFRLIKGTKISNLNIAEYISNEKILK